MDRDRIPNPKSKNTNMSNTSGRVIFGNFEFTRFFFFFFFFFFFVCVCVCVCWICPSSFCFLMCLLLECS